MKLQIIAVTMIMLFLGGCSNTWHGVKEDTSHAYHATKHAIHEATADDPAETSADNSTQPQ